MFRGVEGSAERLLSLCVRYFILNDPTPTGGTPTRHHRGRGLLPKPPATTQHPPSSCAGASRFSKVGHFFVCVECLFLRSPGQAPYRTKSACAKRAAYTDPPPVVPPSHPEYRWHGDGRVFYYCRTYYKAVRVGGGGEWRTCAMRDDEPRPVWMSLLITHWDP